MITAINWSARLLSLPHAESPGYSLSQDLEKLLYSSLAEFNIIVTIM